MNDTLVTESTDQTDPGGPAEQSWVLTLAWCDGEPERVGEALILPTSRRPRTLHFGRGTGEGDRLVPFRIRPGVLRPQAPLASPRLSRSHLEVTLDAGVARVRNIGRGALMADGEAVEVVELRDGQVLEIEGRLVIWVERRAVVLGDWADRENPPFGGPDKDGLVGESPLAWEVRRQLDFLGPRRAHVLVLGPSGSGKELAASGLHRRSGRGGPLVSRNASTLPPGIVDAELFGNVKGYPNAGMPARPGLVGAADKGTLFLDEIGDLPEEVQPHLLRLLDHGEHQVLGDHRSRTVDLRVVGATHRPATALRHDLQARFPLRIALVGLDSRRADIPLIARELLRQILAGEPDLAKRFLDPQGVPRVSAALIAGLLRRPRWTTHVRELRALLWASLLGSRGDTVELPREGLVPEGPPPPEAPRSTPPEKAVPKAQGAPDLASDAAWEAFIGAPPETIPAAALRAALDAHNGHQERTAAALGLSSRFVLARLVKRHGLAVTRRS